MGAESLCYEFTAATAGATPASRTPSKLVLAFQFGGGGSAEQVDRGVAKPDPDPEPEPEPDL